MKIYTDGACIKGNGGWAAVLIHNSYQKELTGFEKNTTNNCMELTAAIKALESIKKNITNIEIFTDSKYVQDGITIWINRWKANRWKGSSGKQIKNKKLWHELDMLVNKFKPEFKWVRGHSGVSGNERADFLSKRAIKWRR